MPREIEVFGLYAPTLLPLFIAAAAAQWGIDAVIARLGWFGHMWHPPLFRLSLFVVLFGGAALLIYT